MYILIKKNILILLLMHFKIVNLLIVKMKNECHAVLNTIQNHLYMKGYNIISENYKRWSIVFHYLIVNTFNLHQPTIITYICKCYKYIFNIEIN